MNSIPTPLYVAGHDGMVGSAVLRRLRALDLPAPLTAELAELDLRDQAATYAFLERNRPAAILIAAARVGGIEANRSYPAQFIYDNLAIAQNLIEGGRRFRVRRILFLGSSCIYPRMAPQPIEESALLTGPLEPTNEAYALAKITGLKLCQFYRRQYGLLYHSAMPTNLYGPGDNYDPSGSHVMPALIRKFHDAEQNNAESVTLWGTGTPKREFLHVDDLADALIHLLRVEEPPDWVNIGSGEEVTIRQLAEYVREAFRLSCELQFDSTKPDGTPRKYLNCERLRSLGWHAGISLKEGIARTVQDFRDELARGTLRG